MRRVSASAALLASILPLPLFAAITGTVTTTDGAAIAGARVSIHALETPQARRARLASATPDPVPLALVQTNDEGSFSLASPKEAVVDLRVELRGYAPFVRRVERDADAVAIALRKIDLLKGTVTANGKPVAKALVIVGEDYLTRTDEQGRYEAPAIKPPYVIAVIHPDYAIDEELVPSGAQAAPELLRTLTPGVTLSGRAVSADGASPVAGATISVGDWPLAVSGGDGAFTIAHAPATWKVISARKGLLAGHTTSGAKSITVRLEPSAVLSGRVRDAKTNAPIAGAMVGGPLSSLPGVVGPTAITDANGTYSIAASPGATWYSTAHPSYAPDSESMRIAPGQQRTHDFAPVPLARVSGVVLDETGLPVAAATVSPRDARNLGMPDMAANGAIPVTSGPDGKFDVRVLAGHDLYLHVARKGLPQGKSDVMKLAAGERKSAVVITLPPGIAVTGRALDADGKPLAGVAVIAGPGVAPGGRETLDTLFSPVEQDPVRTAADGTFAMRLQDGTYNFWFTRDGYLRKPVRAKRITAAGDNAVEARLDPAVEISGRVTRGGVGVAGVEVGSFIGLGVVTTTASDGSFVLGGLAPGMTQFEVTKRDALIDVKRSATAPARGIAIALPAGGTIRGRVVEKGTATPIRSFDAGVLAGVYRLRNFSSEDGSFTIEHVPAGATTVAVLAPGYESTSRDVTVADDAAPDVVLELEPGVRLTGTVTDAQGAPLSGVSVVISPPSGMMGGMIGGTIGGMSTKPPPPRASNDNLTTVTDAEGRYAFDGLVRGGESVQFSRPGYAATTRMVRLAGPETTLDVQLQP